LEILPKGLRGGTTIVMGQKGGRFDSQVLRCSLRRVGGGKGARLPHGWIGRPYRIDLCYLIGEERKWCSKCGVRRGKKVWGEREKRHFNRHLGLSKKRRFFHQRVVLGGGDRGIEGSGLWRGLNTLLEKWKERSQGRRKPKKEDGGWGGKLNIGRNCLSNIKKLSCSVYLCDERLKRGQERLRAT